MDLEHLKIENRLTLARAKEFEYLEWLYSYLVLPFTMQAQTQSNWCWAATATSVSHYYSPFSPWTQCKVASAELDLACCTTPVPGACNVPWYLDKALTRTNNFVSMQSGTVSWSTVKSELEKGLVVCARIGWGGGGGHFMALHGVSSILPRFSYESFDTNKVYDEDEFLAALRRAAAKMRQDDTMGA